MLGSAEQATKTLTELKQFAAETPFEFPELSDAAKKLIAFGFSANETIPELRRLGDVSSGLGIPLGELAELWGKNKVQGRIFSVDIAQLLGRGVPIISELAKVFGVAENEIKSMVEAGQVNFGHLEQALQNMTNKGGKFSGMMAEQSQTLGGLWSTLKDNIGLALTDIGFAIVDTFDLKSVAKNVISFLESLKPQFLTFLETVKAGVNAVKPIIIQLWAVVKARFEMMLEIVQQVFSQVSGVLSGIMPSFTQFRDFILDGLIAVEFGFKNWRELIQLAVSSSMLSIVRFGAEVAHLFTSTIPTYLAFLGENWQTILHDIGEFTDKFLSNLVRNIITVFANIPDLIAGNVSFDELFVPLLEGAEFHLQQLPQIPERVIGDMEAGLQQQVQDITNGLGSSFETFRNEKLKALLPPPEVKQELDAITASAQQATQALSDTVPNELKDKAKDVFDSTRTDLEKFVIEAGQLRTLFDNDLLDANTLNRALENALPNQISQIIEDSKTPLDKLQDGLAELQQFRELNLINDAQFDKAAEKLAKDLNVVQEVKFGSGAMANSKEAAQSIIKHQFGKVPDFKMEVAKNQLAEATKQTDWLAKIAEKIPAMAITPPQLAMATPPAPQVNLPRIAPQMAPQLTMPPMPSIAPPQVNLPRMAPQMPPMPSIAPPQVNLPRMAPQMPPQLRMPPMPSIAPPQVNLPRMAPQMPPQLTVPPMPSIAPPQVNLPRMAPQMPPQVNLPRMAPQMPRMPSITAPMPQLTMPPNKPQIPQPQPIMRESPQPQHQQPNSISTKLLENLLQALLKLTQEEVKETKQQSFYQKQLVAKEDEVFAM